MEGGRGPGGDSPGSRGPSRVCQETCERREESHQPCGVFVRDGDRECPRAPLSQDSAWIDVGRRSADRTLGPDPGTGEVCTCSLLPSPPARRQPRNTRPSVRPGGRGRGTTGGGPARGMTVRAPLLLTARGKPPVPAVQPPGWPSPPAQSLTGPQSITERGGADSFFSL